MLRPIATKGVRLRNSLRRLALNPTELAKRSGVSRNTIYRYLSPATSTNFLEPHPAVLRLVWLMERHPELQAELLEYIEPSDWRLPAFLAEKA